MGYEPVNPLSNGLPADFPWKEHMKADIATLLDCDGIYLLPDWDLSVGARIEANIAAECGMKILRQAEMVGLLSGEVESAFRHNSREE